MGQSSTDHSIAFADVSAWLKTEVAGSEALQWLNDIISADIGALAPGTTRRSLLLSPTGRIRAEFTVARLAAESLLLIQDPDQPSPIKQLLDPYVLSSDVELTDRTTELMLFAFPDLTDALASAEGTWLRPSVLGSGLDLLTPTPSMLATTVEITKLSPADMERRRIVQGLPRLGVDALEGDLPQEAGLADAVSFDKGCYLGQEAVAKVRNLGHPRRVLLRLASDAVVRAGDPLFAGGEEVGRITSAVPVDAMTLALASVRWAARESPLRTSEGAELNARPLP